MPNVLMYVRGVEVDNRYNSLVLSPESKYMGYYETSIHMGITNLVEKSKLIMRARSDFILLSWDMRQLPSPVCNLQQTRRKIRRQEANNSGATTDATRKCALRSRIYPESPIEASPGFFSSSEGGELSDRS
jgi:hypothetical protein